MKKRHFSGKQPFNPSLHGNGMQAAGPLQHGASSLPARDHCSQARWLQFMDGSDSGDVSQLLINENIKEGQAKPPLNLLILLTVFP